MNKDASYNAAALTGLEKESAIQNWQLGLVTSEACRAWVRAPHPALIENETLMREYKRGYDEKGEPLNKFVKGVVFFADRAKLGRIAVRQTDVGHFVVIRHAKYKTWIALLEIWGPAITVYSRWAAVANINIEQSPAEEVFASIVRVAQKASANRPSLKDLKKVGITGPDWIDPASPTLRMKGDEEPVHSPDLWDAVIAWFREFFS